jgi:hypothetical protein
MTAAMTDRPRPSLSYAEGQRESVLAMLADSPHPLATTQLEAAHGMFYTGRIYNQLRFLEAANKVVRLRGARLAAGRSVYWWLPGRPFGECAIAECDSPATSFVPPQLATENIYITDEARGGLQRLFWREITEVPGTGGWVCASTEHQRIVTRTALHGPASAEDR